MAKKKDTEEVPAEEVVVEEAVAEEPAAEEDKVQVGVTKGLDENGKTVVEPIMADPPEPQEGKPVESPPAVAEKQVVHVRGTSVGGQRTMTVEEHAAWCAENKKKAGKG